MTTSTITWKPVSEGLPDVESNVLLGLSSGFTCEGFLDTDHEGAQVWRDVCAVELEDAVVAWAEMPLFDSHADTPASTPASAAPTPLTFEQRHAIREAYCNDAEAAYFSARPQIDDMTRRRVYSAAFIAGYECGLRGGRNG